MIAALRATQPTSELEAAIKTLEAWDNTVSADSRGGTLFNNWWDRYYDKGKGKHAVAWSAAEPTATPRGLADSERAVKLFLAALEEVTQPVRPAGRHLGRSPSHSQGHGRSARQRRARHRRAAFA